MVEQKQMSIPLIDADEVRTGRGGVRVKGVRYGKYATAIGPYVGQLKELIEESKDGHIRVKIKDIAKQMGSSFEKLHPTSIYWGLKSTLFQSDIGIWVNTGKHKDGDGILVMRLATPEDKLPDSLSEDNDIEEDSKDPKEASD